MNQMFRPAQADQRPALETLAGSVERVTFHNAENGFAVLKVHTRGKRDLVTVVGHTPAVSAGEWITASGVWISDRTHGLQFKAEDRKSTRLNSSHANISYAVFCLKKKNIQS